MIRVVRDGGEAAIFLAAAVALHLSVFWFNGDKTGWISGGGAGYTAVSLSGAGAKLSALVEEWERSPSVQSAPQASSVRAADDAPPEVSKAIEPAMDDPATPSPPNVPPTPPRPIPQTTAPVAALPPTFAASLSPLGDFSAATPAMTELLLSSSSAPSMSARPYQAAVAPRIGPIKVGSEVSQATAAPTEKPQGSENSEAAREATRTAPKAAPSPPAKPASLSDLEKLDRPAQAFAPEANSGESSSPSSAGDATGTEKNPVDHSESEKHAEAGPGTSVVTIAESGSGRASLVQAWGAEIRREIERKKRSPRSSRRAGVVLINLSVSRSGALLFGKVEKSSGSPSLDQAALTAVQDAAPFRAAPAALDGERFDFEVPIRFER